MSTYHDIIIVGAGPAGMTAAIYARRAGKSVLLLEGEGFGGQIALSPCVENFPGTLSASGAEIADRMFTQATENGAEAELEKVESISETNGIKLVRTDYGEHECRAVILATGLHHRTLGLEREADFIGKGISFCAVCDGVFYKDKDVAVCGGGNSAVQEALYLASVCRSVTLIHRREEFRADDALVKKLQEHGNIDVRLGYIIKSLDGNKELESLSICRTDGSDTQTLAVSGLFEAIGQTPSNAPFSRLVRLDDAGFVHATEDCHTSCPGIFVAGDCRAKTVRQLTTAAADGAVAALAACDYVDKLH